MKNILGIFIGLIFLLAACAGPQAPELAPYTVVISANEALNLDRNGKPAPVQVKLYKLRGASAFNGSDFFSLFEKDEQVLGSELVSKEIITLQPGETKIVVGKAAGDERMLGVFVAYRNLDKAVWRGVAQLPAATQSKRLGMFSPSLDAVVVKVSVGSNKLSVTSNLVEMPLPTAGIVKRIPGLPGN